MLTRQTNRRTWEALLAHLGADTHTPHTAPPAFQWDYGQSTWANEARRDEARTAALAARTATARRNVNRAVANRAVANMATHTLGRVSVGGTRDT